MTHSSSSRRPARQQRTLVIAAAGYGKSVAMETMRGDGRYVAAADLLSAGTAPPSGDLFVDDLDQLETPEQAAVLRLLDGLDPAVRLVLSSRTPLNPSVRCLLTGPVFERGPADLALDLDGVAQVLRDDYGLDDALLATEIHLLTAGWPALVHFAGDTARKNTSGELLSALADPGAAADWIEHEVIGGLPSEVTASLETAAAFDRLTPDLHALIAADLDRSATASYTWLRRTGLLVPHPRCFWRKDVTRVVPVVAAVLGSARRTPASNAISASQVARAAEWYAGHDEPYAAAQCLQRVGRTEDAVSLALTRGEEMLAAGDAAGVVDILDAATTEQSPTRRQLLGDALRMTGDAPAALRVFSPLVDRAVREHAWQASLAWRVAMVHYMLADYASALKTLDQVPPVKIANERDDVELLACRANVLSMLGAEEEAAAVAAAAVREAGRCDDRAAGAAHLAAANTSTGAAKETHLAQAQTAASRAGDVVLTARVLLNTSYGLLGAARYSQALDVATDAVRLAELGSPPGVLAIALHNRGEALRRLGRFEEAQFVLRRSVAVCQERGLQRAAFGLWGTAEVHRELGRPQQSAIAYDAAIDAARSSGEVQVLVPALSGLARLRAHVTGDLEAARSAAEEARRLTPPEFAAYAHVAAGWVELASGDEEAARRLATEALAAARSSAAIDGLAEALELTAEVSDKSKAARAALDEALAIWSVGGAQPAADRVLVLLGRLRGADNEARWRAREAARRLARRGITSINGQPCSRHVGGSDVEIRLLGGFDVHIGGEAVPLPAWRSKQARTLVKILASRRGRIVTRSELCELLWPDDEPSPTGHRLSVLLSAVRGVLDPERVWPTDHFIAADQTGLSLNLTHVTVDAERILQDSAHAADLLREGDVGRAGELLAEVVGLYRGEALEDEPYADWADGIREQVRTAALRSVRNLASVKRRSGELYEAATLLVRLLAEDPYDEAAHRTLVDVLSISGRHGEARRAFDRWSGAMREIDAPPPDPLALHSGRGSRRDDARAGRAKPARPAGHPHTRAQVAT